MRQFPREYADTMREVILKAFFVGEMTAQELAIDVSGSVVHSGSVHSSVQIEDMAEDFQVQRGHVLKLCQAASEGTLCPEFLTAIAFALMASDTFYWDDGVISEVIADWSAPEINHALTAETLHMHSNWLKGLVMPPQRPTGNAKSFLGRLISVTTKMQV